MRIIKYVLLVTTMALTAIQAAPMASIQGHLPPFNHVVASGGPIQVEMHSQSGRPSYILSSDKQTQPYIHTHVDSLNHTLIIKDEHSQHVKQAPTPKLEIQANPITSIQLSGAVRWQMPGLQQAALSLKLDGMSQFTGTGHVGTLTIHSSGRSQSNANSIVSSNCRINASGASRNKVHCQENLWARISGISQLQTQGHAHATIQRSGRARVEQMPMR